jgi:membrane protein DedA with SNARE-associated domain
VFTAGELWTYLGVFAALLAAGLGFPIPEEIPIVTAGVLASQGSGDLPTYADVISLVAANPAANFPASIPWGAMTQERLFTPDSFRVRWWLLLPVCILGVVVSDGLLYGLGRFFGPKLLERRLIQRVIPPDKRERIERNFHQYGIKILLIARLLPGIRAGIFIIAGVMRLPYKSFLLADGLYAIPGVSLLFFLAYWFTNSFKDMVIAAEAKVVEFRAILILLAIVGVGVYFLVHVFRKPVSTGDPKELPLIGQQVAAHMHSPDARPEPARSGDNLVDPQTGVTEQKVSEVPLKGPQGAGSES